MKGIVLAGGTGSRLYPLTVAVSKQLLPVYDKPMVYYPLSTLMLAGVTEILILTTPQDLDQFKRLLGNGDQWGISLEYKVQEAPNGIAEAFILAEEFIDGDSVALILGDNIFHGSGLGTTLQDFQKKAGATVFAYKVANPQEYGVISFDDNGKALSIEEKPAKPKSNYVIPGLYFYDESVVALAKQLKPSARGELEITDLNNLYLDQGLLNVEVLERGTVWLDTGTIGSLMDASEFVRVLEVRQGTKISAPEEIAWRLGRISSEQLLLLADAYGKSGYGDYLRSLLAS
jgi:glucose-1-phosphate thymidylyltransferase